MHVNLACVCLRKESMSARFRSCVTPMQVIYVHDHLNSGARLARARRWCCKPSYSMMLTKARGCLRTQSWSSTAPQTSTCIPPSRWPVPSAATCWYGRHGVACLAKPLGAQGTRNIFPPWSPLFHFPSFLPLPLRWWSKSSGRQRLCGSDIWKVHPP